MSEFTNSDSEAEKDRWSAVALEWLSDENRKFGNSLNYLLVYLVVGNVAGFTSVLKFLESKSNAAISCLLKYSVVAFSFGVFFAILAALFLVASQWNCLNDYRRRIISLYKGEIDIVTFSTPPNYYSKTIGSLQILAILSFLTGGATLGIWIFNQ